VDYILKNIMSRLCSFDIHFKDRSYITLATLVSREEGLLCRIRFVESRIGYLQPGDVLLYDERKGLRPPEKMPQELVAELERCISASAH
jgi:hypothetical protein